MYRTAIDPIVHYREDNSRSSSPRPESVGSLGSSYPKVSGLVPPNTSKIGGHKVPLSPLLSNSPKQLCYLEDTYSRASHFTRSIKTPSRLKPASASYTDGIQFYSLQEGLDWEAKGFKSDWRERPDHRRPEFIHPVTVRENANYLLRDRLHNSLTSLSRVNRGRKSKLDEPDHYRSVLYVVSRDSPKLTHRHRCIRSTGIPSIKTVMDDNVSFYDSLGSGHLCSPSTRSLRLRKKIPSPRSNSSFTEPYQSKEPSKYKANIPHVDFQGAGRGTEERLRKEAVRSPKLVEARGSWSSSPQTIYSSHAVGRLHSLRNDSNHVIVDIKPRLVSEADKHQNTSQWIQVGTLGDAKVNLNRFGTSSPDDSHQGGINSILYDQRKDNHEEKTFEEIFVRKVIHEEESLHLTSMEKRRTNDRFHVNQSVVKPTGKTEVETIFEEQNTPEGTTTNSVRSNITVNISPYDREQYFAQNLARSVRTEQLEGTTVDEGGGEAPTSDPEFHDDELSATHSAPLMSNNVYLPTKGGIKRNELLKFSDDNSKNQNPSHSRIRPEVAPKPTPMEQLAAILEKPSTEMNILKSQGVSDMNLSNPTTPLYVHGTFPRSTQNMSKEVPQHSPFGTTSLTNERFDDPHVPNVRNLAAFFTELIRKQQQPSSPRCPGNQCTYDRTDLLKSDDQKKSPPSSPFFLRGETAEERERRLKAVENLRKRSTNLPPVDYSKYGVKQTCKTENHHLDDPHIHNRPPSTQRPRYTYMTTNVTRSNTPLSTNEQHIPPVS